MVFENGWCGEKEVEINSTALRGLKLERVNGERSGMNRLIQHLRQSREKLFRLLNEFGTVEYVKKIGVIMSGVQDMGMLLEIWYWVVSLAVVHCYHMMSFVAELSNMTSIEVVLQS